MRILIVTNLNGIGLETEAKLLRDFLVSSGHEVKCQQYDQSFATKYDLGIMMETISPQLVPLAPRWWYVANPEWLKQEYVGFIRRYCEKVIAKTREAERTLSDKFSNVVYTGFLTRDRYDASVTRERRFLHIGGNSGLRNTQAVISAWREYRYWNGVDAENAELTVVSNAKEVVAEETLGVTFVRRVSDEEVTRLQNSHLFHLYPSAYEGFGHALHEAQGVGAVLLTTDAPPMSEFGASFTVPSIGVRKKNFGVCHEVSAAAIRERVPEMLGLEDGALATISDFNRSLFHANNDAFRERFSALLAPGPVSVGKRSGKLQIALLGNLTAPNSTENDLVWTLRDLGHRVVTYQENWDRTERILEECKGMDLFVYVHTHGWETPGDITVSALIKGLRESGTVTASFHLDRYWGLNKLDGREDRIGGHPFWKTDFVFTADGGNDARFKERGVNHHWLPPGVIKRDCRQGVFCKKLATEVGFVGAVGYHPEYPFRGELLEFLKGVYRDRFNVFSGFRGQALNDLYASVKILVGDSCFGGVDRYWSDRVPETIGRGGFLVHPAAEGLTIPGLVTFEAGNLEQLEERIDYYLKHEEEREALRSAASAWVESNETYHERMREMIRVCGL